MKILRNAKKALRSTFLFGKNVAEHNELRGDLLFFGQGLGEGAGVQLQGVQQGAEYQPCGGKHFITSW